PIEGLKALISHPAHASRHWVYEQYDSQVMADTIRAPGLGAGVIRVHGTAKALAFTSDVTPRYVVADPREGGKQAVAEAYRNLVSVGAWPLAATDNMNFGNPEKPEIMGQFVGAIKGIAAACAALDMPIVSGNVSLYNETDGSGILPTPTIGAVGLIEDVSQMIPGLPRDGDLALVVGKTHGHLGRSALLDIAFGRRDGPPPPVDLRAERRHGEFVLRNRGLVNAATDLSDGGLALAAFEMAEAAGIGVTIDKKKRTASLFGEDQARYLLACPFDAAEALMTAAAKAGVPVRTVGRFGGDTVTLGRASAPLAELSAIYRGAFAAALG
ncbi:AIR synthase related protein, partial [Palleronia rufa]